MFAPLLSAVQLRLEEAVKRGVFSLAAALVLVLALGFFAAGGWFAIDASYGPVVASFAIGAALLVVAILLALVARRRRVIVAAPVTPAATATGAQSGLAVMAPVLAQAFATGFFVGLKGK